VLIEAIGQVYAPCGQYAIEVPPEALRAALKDIRGQ